MRLVEPARTTRAFSLASLPVVTRGQFTNYLVQEIEDAYAARASQESLWRELLRMNDGQPKFPVRNTPVENAPNVEIPLGAIESEDIYAQAIDLMFQITPVVTVRDAGSGQYVRQAKALQVFANWGVENEWGLRVAVDHTVLDDVQLGTGVYAIPLIEGKTKRRAATTVFRAPMVRSVPIEDFLVPGGAYENLQRARWCSEITWLSDEDLSLQATAGRWDIAQLAPAKVEWVRTRRESLARTTGQTRVGNLYEIHRWHGYYDIDGDGVPEDVEAVYDRTSQSLLAVGYNRYDSWHYEAMRYQLRAHLFYGMGVIEMVQQMQTEVSDLHNHRTLNVMLANCRMWAAKRGVFGDNMLVWPNRVLQLDNPATDLRELKLSDVYPSAAAAEAITIGLAERRTGSHGMGTGARPSQILGSRTPATTAVSMLQKSNQRFTPAFDGMRIATAGAVVQCLRRYHEQVRAQADGVEQHLRRLLGDQQAQDVLTLLRDPDFERNVSVTLTASSASINRDADRQNAVVLMNALAQYYEKTLNLVAIAANPATPGPVKEVAQKIARAGSEVMDRLIRTFDQIRDPQTFIVTAEEQIDASVGAIPQNAAGGLAQLVAALGGGEDGAAPEP